MDAKAKAVVAALVMMVGLAGCGGDGESRRTDVACTRGDASCGTVHMETPAAIGCGDGSTEVESCSEADALATCAKDVTSDDGARGEMVVFIYDEASLEDWKLTCVLDRGQWTDLRHP